MNSSFLSLHQTTEKALWARSSWLGTIILAFFVIYFHCSLVFGVTVQKSPADKRLYRQLVLENQLEALLISDPDTDLAAASLAVNVGQFHDPKDRLGMAHYLEHMLFLGTEKYPETGEFGKYLSNHGGQSNAFTSMDNTVYYFTVQKDHFEGAVDRFAQFFISPTFDPKFAERELNVVNAEHQKNLQNDRRRIFQVTRHLSNPEHPFSKFSTGSIESLKANGENGDLLRKQLIEFYQSHYSAKVMKLVILGKEPLDELEKFAKTYFGGVPDKDIRLPRFKMPVILDEDLPRKIEIEPVKEFRQLSLQFPAPSQVEHYLNKPEILIAQLIGDESEGSILSILKKRGWALGLSAGGGLGAAEFSIFNVSVNLTPEGLNHTEEIIEMVFAYIELIKNEPDLKRYYEEIQKMAELNLQFKQKEQPEGYVPYLASELLQVPAKHAVVSRFLYQEYKQDLIEDLLSYLTPENLQVVLIHPGVKGNLTEKWYGTRYRVESIPKKKVKDWKRPEKVAGLGLPNPNPFIPEKIAIKPKIKDEPFPKVLTQTPALRFWYKKDNTFEVPKANVFVVLSTAKAYQSIEGAIMTNLFTQILEDKLNEFSYPASQAGLNYKVVNSVRGIELSFGGYAENIPLLFEKVITQMKRLQIDPKKFKLFKKDLIQERSNRRYAEAYHLGVYETQHLLSETLWHDEDYIANIDKIEFEDLKAFVPELLSNMKAEVLAHGNLSEKEGLQLAKILEENLLSKSKNPQVITERTLKLKPGESLKYRIEIEDQNSAVVKYYQDGPSTNRRVVILDFINSLMEKPLYHRLRTVEQLGYIVWSGDRRMNKVGGLSLLVQSADKDPLFLEQRIEAFLKDFYQKTIQNLPKKTFERTRATLIEKRKQDPKNLNEETSRYWNEISDQSYDFEERKKQIKELEKLTSKDVIKAFYEILIDPKERKSISLLAQGKKHKLAPIKNTIKDPKKFKMKREFYENPTKPIGNHHFVN